MSSNHDPYANLADLYDSMAQSNASQQFYSMWRNSLQDAIRQYKNPVRVLVDLACGTGNTTIPWTKNRGWTLIGVDCSLAMLREARKKSNRVRWICQDLRELHLDLKADVATCHFDSLNHILGGGDLQKVFTKVARILNKSGLFQFDLSTDFLFIWLNVHEKLFRVGPNYFMAYNKYDSKKRIVTFHQLWFVRSGHIYKKREICVQEAAYTETEVRSMLKKVGLRPLKISVCHKLEGKPARLLYLVQKA